MLHGHSALPSEPWLSSCVNRLYRDAETSLLCFKASGTEEGKHPGEGYGYFLLHEHIHRGLTLEAFGSRLSERKENVTHDGRAAHP